LLLRQAEPTGGSIQNPHSATRIGGIFQNVSQNLVPWKTVAQNVGLPGIRREATEHDTSARVLDALSRLGIARLASRFPYQLSVGQQQMAILARWIAFPPDLLLVDEAWSNLDVTQQPVFRDALIQLATQTGCAIAVVSHDLPELLELADSILVLTPRPARRAAWIECSNISDLEAPRKQLWDAVAANFNHSTLG
jgi:ABC-type nitrate/sulfonate/bicarbonate transport system ATPase subunit